MVWFEMVVALVHLPNAALTLSRSFFLFQDGGNEAASRVSHHIFGSLGAFGATAPWLSLLGVLPFRDVAAIACLGQSAILGALLLRRDLFAATTLPGQLAVQVMRVLCSLLISLLALYFSPPKKKGAAPRPPWRAWGLLLFLLVCYHVLVVYVCLLTDTFYPPFLRNERAAAAPLLPVERLTSFLMSVAHLPLFLAGLLGFFNVISVPSVAVSSFVAHVFWILSCVWEMPFYQALLDARALVVSQLILIWAFSSFLSLVLYQKSKSNVEVKKKKKKEA